MTRTRSTLAWMLKSHGKKYPVPSRHAKQLFYWDISLCHTLASRPVLAVPGELSHVTSYCQLTPCSSPRSSGWTTCHLDSSQLPPPAEEKSLHLFRRGVSPLLLLYPDFPHCPWNALFCHCYLENSLRVKTKIHAHSLLCGSSTRPCCTQVPVTFNEQATEK